MDKQTLIRLAFAGMMAGSLSLTACNSSTSEPAAGNSPIAGARSLAEFKTECEAAGGTFKSHECNAQNECKGHSFQEGKGVASHDCKGHSACQGGSCIEA